MRRGRELDAVSAALAEVQARQQSLSRGAVLPRANSPPTAASSSPVVAKEAAPRRPPPSQWLQRRVVRRSERQEAALEDLGSLELVPSASLAAARALVAQFIALPPRREFRFVHPTTGARVGVAEESGVPVAGLPFLCIALLPVKEVASGSSVAGSIEIKDGRGCRPVTALQQLTPQQTKPRPQTVESSAKRPGVDVVKMTAGGVLERAPCAADKEMALPAKQVPLAVDREPRKVVAKDRKEEGKPTRAAAASAGSKRTTGELRLALETPATSRASILLRPDVKLRPGPTAAHKVSDKLRNTTQRDRSASIRSAKEIAVQASTGLVDVLLTVEEKELVRGFSPRTSVPQENTSSGTTLLDNQDAAQENVTHDGVRTDEAGVEMTLETTTSSERGSYRKPGPLRRSRHFKALSVAKLAEKFWNTEEPGSQELVSDEHMERQIRVVVEMFYTDLPGVDSHQLRVACQYYGIDYQGLGLQGLLLALDGDLSAKCNHVRGGVDGQLTQYLLKLLLAEFENVQDVEAVRHFENALNLFAGMRGWQAPTKLRASVFEDKQRLQLIPAWDSRRLALLRLSDKDRQLFALASTGNALTGLEKWLADGLEITYVLLYGFLHSKRNSGPKSLAKLETVHGRQERILAAVQNLSSFSFEVWKRLEFRTSDIEDVSMVRRLNELLRGFVRDSNLYSGEVEGSVFFPAIVGYLARKSAQLGQSLSGLMISATRGPQQSAAMECIRLLRQLIQQQELHSTATETYLANTGLRIIDVDKINASRSSAGLGRIFVSGKESILTQYQCKMMARDPALHMKARYEQQEMALGKISRYFFVGAKNTALEYSFVRTKPDTHSGDSLRWEDREALAKKEAQSAFALFCSESLAVPLDAAVGVGINLIHADLLPHISSLLSLSTVLREYSATTSISLGYCYEPATHSTRVVFRVHSDVYNGFRRRDDDSDTAECWRLPSVVQAVDRFLCYASAEEAVAFCEAEGLGFLYSCLQKQGNPFRTVKFGMPFSEYLHSADDAVSPCQREILLQTIKRTVAIIPRALQSITRQNIQIIVQLIEDFPASLDLGDEAVAALQAICSNGHWTVLQSENMHSAFPMTSVQRQFSAEGGLDILVSAVTRLQGLPARKEALEIAIVTLLTAHEYSTLKSGLLTHWREWLEFYVDKRAWKLSAVTPEFSVFLLRQLHGQFFALNGFVEPIDEMCSCGCNGRPIDTVDACVGIMQIFVRLMLSELGVTWAQEEMQGPQDCVSFLSWSVQQNASRMEILQQLILQSLSEFLERLTSSHQYLQVLSLLTPQLLALLSQQNCPSIHSSTLRVLSITFRLAVDKKVWLISLETFLTAYYRILECICDDPSSSEMNGFMAQVLFKSEYPHDGGYSSSNMLQLLHEEHVNFVGGSGQLSPVARSRTKSFLQSLVSFCSLTWNSVLQPHCQIPAVISLGWLLNRLEIAEDLAVLELDEVLMSLMESDNTVLCILATRACSVFFFQALLSRRTMDEHRLKRLCNLLTTALQSGTRLMLSPKRGSDADNPDAIQFAMNHHELYETLLRYNAFNTERRRHIQQQELELDDAPEVEQPQVTSIWENSEWSDSSRASAEKLTANLKLLTVFSSMTTNIASIGNSDEIRQIVLLLVIFVRDRVHSIPHHVTLYLLPLRNIIWATRSELAKWGLLELTEATFLRKLLLLSTDRVHQELASAILWGLADAYEKTNTSLLSFEVDDALTKGSYFTKKTGLAVLVANLSSRIASGHCVESEAGALASMVANSISGGIFVTDYGYPFVLKLIDSSLRSIITGHVVGAIGPNDEEPSTQSSTGELLGTTLFYAHPVKHQKDRELLQLCRSATKALDTMLRASPESILDEAARTKATMLPLLNYPNKQIVLHAIRCCSIHLQGHPTKCGKLFVPEVQDKVIAFFFEETYPPIQAAAFSCMKLALADQKSLGALQAKIWPLRERIVSCLRSPHFQVKQKVIVFLVEAIFRFDDQTFLDGIAGAFATSENQGIIVDLFDSLSKEIEANPAAGGALQSVIRLILKLDLVAHTNGDELVHAICLTLKAHCTDTFLRPTLFDCLCQIVTQDDRVAYLERKSRLDAITALLSQQLTLSELRNVANMLFTVARKHDGIRRYLSGFTSSCIPKIVGVVNSFSEYANAGDAHIQDAKTSSSEVAAGTLQRDEVIGESPEMVLLKVTTAKTVYLSHLTEDIYEQFLNLLLLLITGLEFSSEERYGCLCEEDGCSSCDPCDIIAKTRCGHSILRIAAAHRVVCPTYDLTHLLSAAGDVAETVLNASTEVLEILSANHQSRVQMLRGAAKLEWSWMSYLVRNVALPEYPIQTTNEDIESRIREVSAEHSILLLGHLSAAKEVAQRLVTDSRTISLLFSYLSPADPSRTINVDIRRAASFTLARLAEHPSAVVEPFFQERMAMLTHAVAIDSNELESSEREHDTIVLVNRMVLGRNRALHTPGLQGRSVDDATLTLLIQLLIPPRTDDADWREAGVGLIAADVLSHLLFFRVKARDEKRLRAVLWRYARAMSPTKPTQEQDRPSSKRLTAYLHNWIGPMLQKLRQSAFSASRGDTLQLLQDELSYSCQQLDEVSTVSELLRVLVVLHIESDEPLIETETTDKETIDTFDSDDTDAIVPYTFKGAKRPRKRLHVAFNEADRSTREANDGSFHGSSHLWLFLQKLWELATEESKNGNGRAILAITDMKEIMRANIPTILKRWHSERGTSFSLSAFEKRQSFLEFVILISEDDPELLTAIDAKTLLQVVAQDSTATLGREYHLLCRACQKIPQTIELILQFFRPDGDQHAPNEQFSLFWQRVRLNHLPVQIVHPTASKTTFLDLSPDTNLATIFGVELLKMLTSREPLTVRWYALYQGATQLLDMMLLASRASALQLQHLTVRSFLANLLYLVDQLVDLDQDKYRRIFERDPRYIRCMVDLIYAPAHEVQSSAIKLVQNLALHPPLFGMLSLLESLTQPLGSVRSEAVAYVKETLSRHQISPPFSQDRVVLLAHIWLVPFLMDLSVTELVKLSFGFSSCTEVAEDSWVLLTNDFRFGAIPEWMLEANASAQVSFNDAMKHIQKRFEGALHQRTQSLSMYGITKEAYVNATTVATRRRVALRLGNLLKTYQDETKMYRSSVRSRNGLVMRLGRLLVEDRAEIIRRVAYTKRIPERTLFDRMQDQQLSDLLTLLQENPLFQDVPRDHLAILALRLGSPVDILIAGSKQRLPLLLVFDEAVEFEMCVPGNLSVLRGTLTRGGLLGFPPWLGNADACDEDNWTVVYKCQLLATILSSEVLESELPEPSLSLVMRRLGQAYEIGDVQAISELMGLQVPKFTSSRRRLQSSASALLVQLTTADIFINNILNDSWAIRIIVDVAQAALPSDIVLNALTVVAAMTANEAFAKRFCTKAMRNRTHGKAAEITSPLSLVVSLVNQFKLRLWLSHPEILAKFFLVQAQVACCLPSFWPNLEKIWSAKYICGCLDLLRSGSTQIIDVVGCHLSSAIPHRADFLLDCGNTTDFHLALATILSRSSSGNIVGVLRLFNAFCINEKLREEIWENVVTSSQAFDGALQLVALAISECFDLNNCDDLEVYCNFLHLLCGSGIDEILDSEFQERVEIRFGILSVLLARLPHVLGTRSAHVVLRCIGSICFASKTNAKIAATTSAKDNSDQPILANAVVSALTELIQCLKSDQGADFLLVEATFSCVDIFTTGTDRMESFSPASLVAVALSIIRDSTATTKSLNSTTIPALAAVVRSMLHVLASNQDDYLEAFSDGNIRLLCAGYERISDNSSEAADDIEIQRLLGAYTELLDMLLSSRRYCDLLWTTCFQGADSSSLFVTWVYHWIIFKASESPKVKALIPARNSKHLRLLAVADKMQSATLSLATRLSKHEAFSEVFSVHPDFGEVVAHIFAALRNSNSDDTERSIAGIKLLCFVAEQWDHRETFEKSQAGEHQHRSKIIRAFLPYVPTRTLLKACRLERESQDSFVGYAVRFLWLLVKLQSGFTPMELSCEEWLELVSLASDILQRPLFSGRTKCYVVGLLAELSADEVFLMSMVQAPGLDDVVKSGLMLLGNDHLAPSKALMKLNASSVTDDFLSSRRWSPTKNREGEMRFGVSHELQRFILHLYKVPEIRQGLSKSSFFHPMVSRTVFVESIALLSTTGNSRIWTTAQLDSLNLIAALLDTSIDTESRQSIDPSALRSYRLVARREGLLQHCICLLLEEQTHDFQLAVIESLLRYMDQHISASLEVAALREQGRGDLMNALLTTLGAYNATQDPEISNLSQRSLELYISCIEFSFKNAVYAANSDNLSILTKLRESAASHGTLINSNLPQTLFCITRMLGSSNCGVVSCVVDEIWNLTCATLLHPEVASHLKSLCYVLEILKCSESWKTEICEIALREWEERGRLVVECLASFANNDHTSEAGATDAFGVTIAELSAKAIMQLCSSAQVCENICNDTAIVASLLHHSSDRRQQTELLNFMVARENPMLSHLDDQLLVRLAEIYQLNRDDRLFLFELLPSVASLLDRCDGVWSDILACIIAEMNRNSSENKSEEDHLTTARALCSVVNDCDLNTIPREMIVDLHVVLKQLIGSSTAIRDCAPSIFQDENYLHPSVTMSKAAVVNLMLLYSLNKLSPYFDPDLRLIERFGPPCCSIWMCISTSRGYNVQDEEVTLLLGRLVFYYLRFSDQAASLGEILHFLPYWRVVVRMFTSVHEGELYRSIIKLLLQLVQGPASRDVQEFARNTMGLNLIDELWWQVLPISSSNEDEMIRLRGLWCSLLHNLCCSRANGLSIMEKRFLEQFILLEYRLSSDTTLETSGNTSLLRLLSAVFRVTSPSDHDVFLRKDPATMETLADHCVRTVSAILGISETKWNATQVLYALASHEQTLTAIRHSCGLDPSENDSEKRRMRLCALSELLLLCGDDIADLTQVLTLMLQIFGSREDIAMLIRARIVSDCWPMVDVLVEILHRCMLPFDDTLASRQSQLRPILLSTSDPAEFLPCNVSTEAHATATSLALQLVYLCVNNHDFAESLKSDIDLLEQLFLCLATSNWVVSSTGAAALSSLIGGVEDLDGVREDNTDIFRYDCDNGIYRKLEFFTTLDAQNTFSVSPPSLYPPCFVLLTRWIRFYSVNLPFLGCSEVVVPFNATEEDPSQLALLPNLATHDVHETIVLSVLDVLLYCVSNFHSEIYKNDNGEEEEREHSLLLQSLLALCQRRSSAAEDADASGEGDPCVVVHGEIRSRSLELVQLLCSLELPRTSSVQVFASAKQMMTLMMIVERSASTIEQCAASQLIEALARHDVIKALLVGKSSLLSRLGAWLEKDKLQLLAADITQRLAIPAIDSKRLAGASVFSFSPSVQQQLAHFLIVGRKTVVLDPRENVFRFNRTRAMVVTIQLEDREKQSPRSSSTAAFVLLRLGWKLLSQSGRSLRSFQYDGTLHNDKDDSIQFELMLEQAVASIHLTVTIWSTVDSKESSHEFELPVSDTSFLIRHSDTDTIRITQGRKSHEQPRGGALPRLLRQERDDLSTELFQGLSGVVVEFCKSFTLFCDPVIDLPSQILVVLATSVGLSPVGRMDVACLDGLATWFPSNPSIAFFKKSISPLLHLIRGLRRLSCVAEYVAHEEPSNEAAETAQEIQMDVSGPPQLTFLEKFIQLIASVEVADLTPNCLNVVFMENADVLLYLCAQFAPDRDPNTTFLSLVAIAIRSSVVHCQAFLTSNAQSLVRSVFDAGMKNCGGRSEYHQSSLLSYASLVVMRLARCPLTSHDSSAVAARLGLFSRVSFEVFARREWVECFPLEAARNIVLACGFLSDGIAKPVAVDAGTSEADKYASLLVGIDSPPSEVDPLPSLHQLTAVETLLLFLGRSARLEDDGQVTSDSYDRLAARVLASLIEKLPARKQLELRTLELLDNHSSALTSGDRSPQLSLEGRCLSGMRKCLFLTRYDFQSDLNALRLTYYSSIRAGVRTGIIPPQCSGVFQHFDQEYLLSTSNGEQPSVSSSKHLIGEDSKLESELRELLLFANKHAELLSVLIVNRKKAMTSAFRVATRNARVLVAFHAMTSIALDFYIDSVKRFQNSKRVKRRTASMGIAEQTTFMEWLILLEELAGLVCSGLHELDASYYTEIARQFKSLVVDLPVFLRKMERLGTHSRQQALLLFLDNLHRLLKRATNRNELRVVAANGSGVVDQTKTVRESLKRLDPQISASLGLLLESQDGMESLSRALVAMTYMWRRTMGATSLEKAMATSKESVGLLKKIKEKMMAVLRAVHRPRKVLRAVVLVIFKFGSKPQRFDSPAAPQSSLLDANSGSTDQSSSECDASSAARRVDTLLSPFPFSSLELALDHFGWEASSAKRTKLLLQLSSRKASVLDLLSSAFGASEDAVERLSVLELADHFHRLEAENKLAELLARLGELTLDEDMAFTTLPCVRHDKMDMSLWRLMVRPIQRVRLFHLYQQTQRFVAGDRAKRKLLLDGYRQDSPLKPAPLNETQSTRKNGLDLVEKSVERRTAVGQEPPLPTPGALSLTAKVLIPQSTLSVCDGILSRDPLSDDAAMRLLRQKNKEMGAKPWWLRRWVSGYGRSVQYQQARPDNLINRAVRVVISLAARFVLVLAFWRQDELHADLHDPVMARAFDDPSARDDYYRLYHAKKGLGELIRVWMPSSGRLGLSLWQERRYALGGTLMSIAIALWLPLLVSPAANDNSETSTTVSDRNIVMTRVVYSYGIGIFVLSVVSIALIAQNRFVLLEQTRLRLRPISRYYQNFMAVAAIVVELVQLNSLAFDAAVEWDDTDELPAAMQWLGQQGLTRFGVSSVSELQALGILLLLLSWFLLLKCANKFQDTSVLLHRVLTKDLPALVNGFFYMGTISAFFSFLACVDCSKLDTASSKCAVAPQSPPFLIAYPSVTCWTPEHQWYALLGLWGITFFLPIGLLAHGMSQVLFQRETLDIKYAPVLLLVTQLVKAVAATAQAFFPFEPLVLASLGFIGNGVLFILTLAMHSCSLWYIKYVKCSIYAASCWASLGAIHRLHYAGQSSTRSLNMIYFGWLTILLATAAAILLRVWRRARAKRRDADLRFAAQQRLLNVGKATGGLGAVEQKFLSAATRHSRDAFTWAAFVSNATRLEVAAPPPVLEDFVARAKEGNENDTPHGVLFMQSARVLATKLHEHDGVRRRR